MQIVLKVLIALIALLFVAMGVQFMFTPEAGAVQFGLQPLGNAGLNSLRGDIGGMFLGSAAMLVMGLLRGQTLWFLAVAVVIGMIAVGRLVGFVLDGASQGTLAAFAVELITVIVLLLAHRTMRARTRA